MRLAGLRGATVARKANGTAAPEALAGEGGPQSERVYNPSWCWWVPATYALARWRSSKPAALNAPPQGAQGRSSCRKGVGLVLPRRRPQPGVCGQPERHYNPSGCRWVPVVRLRGAKGAAVGGLASLSCCAPDPSRGFVPAGASVQPKLVLVGSHGP
jgi:hypothetical protein